MRRIHSGISQPVTTSAIPVTLSSTIAGNMQNAPLFSNAMVQNIQITPVRETVISRQQRLPSQLVLPNTLTARRASGVVATCLGSKSEKKCFKCALCNMAFDIKGNLTKHIRRHIIAKPFTCYICSDGFTQKKQLENHILRKHHGMLRLACSLCGKISLSVSDHRDHFFTHSAAEREIHGRAQSGEKRFKCDICGAAFNQRRQLVNHRRGFHSRELDPTSNTHVMVFNSRSADREQKSTHSRWTQNDEWEIIHEQKDQRATPENDVASDHSYAMPGVCFLTEAASSPMVSNTPGERAQAIGGHDANHRVDSHLLQASPIAGLKESDAGFASYAIDSDRSPVPECDDNGTGTDRSLAIHSKDTELVITHLTQRYGEEGPLWKPDYTKKRSLKCDICGQTFKWEGSLNYHKLIHCDPNRFGSEICGKAVRLMHNLSDHPHDLSKARDFQCEVCLKVFKRNTDLKRHRNRKQPCKRLAEGTQVNLPGDHLAAASATALLIPGSSYQYNRPMLEHQSLGPFLQTQSTVVRGQPLVPGPSVVAPVQCNNLQPAIEGACTISADGPVDTAAPQVSDIPSTALFIRPESLVIEEPDNAAPEYIVENDENLLIPLSPTSPVYSDLSEMPL